MPASEARTGASIRIAVVANTARCDVDRVRALVARERRMASRTGPGIRGVPPFGQGWAGSGIARGRRARVDWFPTSTDRPGEAARLAVGSGAALVVAVGGDGIAHDVAGAIAECRAGALRGAVPVGRAEEPGAQPGRCPHSPSLPLSARFFGEGTGEPMLAIVPVGTGNFLARGAGVRVPFRRSSRRIARDVARILAIAEDSIRTGSGSAGAAGAGGSGRAAVRTALMDLGEIEALRRDGSHETAWFSVQAGFGWDAEALRRSPAGLKRRLRWGAYVVGLVRATLAARTLGRGGSVGGHRHDAVGVVASVGGALPLGVRVVPGSRTGDGRIGVALVRPRRVLDWVGVVARTLASSWLPPRMPEAPGARSAAQPASSRELEEQRAAHRRPVPGVRRGGACGTGIAVGARRPSPVAYASRRELDLRFDAPTACELDGEPFGEVVAARLRVLPAPIRILVP